MFVLFDSSERTATRIMPILPCAFKSFNSGRKNSTSGYAQMTVLGCAKLPAGQLRVRASGTTRFLDLMIY